MPHQDSVLDFRLLLWYDMYMTEVDVWKNGGLPAVSLDYLDSLTDSTGILQHGAYTIPDRHHGYSTDDTGRGLIAALDFHDLYADPRTERLVRIYLEFLHHAQRPDGRFHTFMNYGAQFTDEPGNGDALGRAAWGLGYLCSHWPDEGAKALARRMLDMLWGVVAVDGTRPIAYCCVAAREYLRAFPEDDSVRAHLERYAQKLVEFYNNTSADEWRWFEDTVRYGNAILPCGLLMAYDVLGEPRFAEVGRITLDFLIDVTLSGSYLDVVGNAGWYPHGGTRAQFDQQPIDAGYMVIALDTAAELFGSTRYRKLSMVAGQWFLGRNVVGEPLYDPESGGCHDGIQPGHVNQNMGAESTIACLMALLRLHHRQGASSSDEQPAE